MATVVHLVTPVTAFHLQISCHQRLTSGLVAIAKGFVSTICSKPFANSLGSPAEACSFLKKLRAPQFYLGKHESYLTSSVHYLWKLYPSSSCELFAIHPCCVPHRCSSLMSVDRFGEAGLTTCHAVLRTGGKQPLEEFHKPF